MLSCQYAAQVGGSCGCSIGHPANSECSTIGNCNKDVRNHLKAFGAGFADSSLKTEADLLARAGTYLDRRVYMWGKPGRGPELLASRPGDLLPVTALYQSAQGNMFPCPLAICLLQNVMECFVTFPYLSRLPETTLRFRPASPSLFFSPTATAG